MQNFESTYETQIGQESQYEIIPEIFQEETHGYEMNPSNESPGYEFSNWEINPEYVLSPETSIYGESKIDEVLVNELNEVTTEEEFGKFLSNLVQKGAGVASGFLNSPTGKNVTNYLTNVAKKTIPNVASALGGKVLGNLGGQLGSVIGGRIGGTTGAGLGKDILGYAGQKLGTYGGGQIGTAVGDRMAAFIKFAKEAIQRAANANPNANPSVNSQQAIVDAAKRFYPFILRRRCVCPKCGTAQREANYEGEVYQGEFNTEFQGEITNEGVFSESLEIQLASELLSINSEDELDRFLGRLIKRAAGAVKSLAKSSIGKSLGGLLKNVAKTALPFAAKAVGTYFGGPLGGMIGGKLGNMAAGLFELELEGMSQEDREFEVARRFVRFASNAATRASRINTGINPALAARKSFIEAARRYAPGVLNYQGDYNPDVPDYSQSGNWFRQGNSIILQGI
jgi:hypothetical protein